MTQLPSENQIDILRKRLIMRAEHRGIKEMDIILGRFVRNNVADFQESDIVELENMMDENDQALYAMITGHQPMMDAHAKWLKRLQEFSHQLQQ